MRFFLATVLAVALSFGSPALAQMAPAWAPSVDAALQAARQSNRLVLLYFCGDRCGACRELEQTVLSQPQVMGQIVANYVPVKLNADQNARLATNCGVNALPTIVVTTVDGQIVDRIIGKKPAGEFLGLLGQIAAKAPRTPPPTALAGTPGMPGGAAAAPPPGSAAAVVPGSPSVVVSGRPPISQEHVSDAIAEYYASRQPSISASTASAPRGADATSVDTSGIGAARSPSPSRPQPPVGASAGDTLAGTPSIPSPSSPSIAPAPARPAMMPALPATPPAPVGGGMTKPSTPAPSLAAAPSSSSRGSAVMPPAVQPPRLPTGVPPLALDGFCPVTMIEKNKWVQGDVRYGAIHEGRTYLFVGPEEQKKFLGNFNTYAPVLGGRDIVVAAEKGETVVGTREFGAVIFDRVYLFSSEASRQRFMANPEPYIHWATATANRSGALPGAMR